MTTARDLLLKLGKSVHSIPEIELAEGVPLHFMHLKAAHSPIIQKMMNDNDTNINTVVFALSVCDEDGNLLFTLDQEDLDLIDTLPRTVVNVVANAAFMGDEKKPLGV